MTFELYEGNYGGVECLMDIGPNAFDHDIIMMQRVFMVDIDGLWIYTNNIGYGIIGVDDV
jgi:hypothetical protein